MVTTYSPPKQSNFTVIAVRKPFSLQLSAEKIASKFCLYHDTGTTESLATRTSEILLLLLTRRTLNEENEMLSKLMVFFWKRSESKKRRTLFTLRTVGNKSASFKGFTLYFITLSLSGSTTQLPLEGAIEAAP